MCAVRPAEVLIVAGTEYARYEGGTGPNWTFTPLRRGEWREVALLWSRRELQKPNVTVTLFDCFSGTVEKVQRDGRTQIVSQYRQPSGQEWREWDAPKGDSFRKPAPVLVSKIHPALAYLAGAAAIPDEPLTWGKWHSRWRALGPLGMQTIYNYLCEVGRARPGSVTGLHIFSHSYYDGPILFNSWDFAYKINDPPFSKAPCPDDLRKFYESKEIDKKLPPPRPRPRDPDDMDARVAKDFGCTNLPALADITDTEHQRGVERTREWFTGAFADEAEVVIWGCNKSKIAAGAISRVMAAIGGRAPDLKMPITFHYDNASAWEGVPLLDWQKWMGLVALDAANEAPERDVTHTLAEFMLVLAADMDGTYAGQLKLLLNSPSSHRHVCVAPVGTQSSIDRGGGANRALSVVGGQRILQFWKDVMGATFAMELGGPPPFGRGFVRVLE